MVTPCEILDTSSYPSVQQIIIVKLSVGLIEPGFVTLSRLNSIGENGLTKFWIKKFDTTTYLFQVTVTLALCDTKLEGLELANFALTLLDRDIWSGNTTLT